jgi:hypothetical protein
MNPEKARAICGKEIAEVLDATLDAQVLAHKENCIHHWMLPPPNGPTCIGKCKLCSKEQTFRNSEPKIDRRIWTKSRPKPITK